MLGDFKTIKKHRYTDEIVEKKSKFIANLIRVDSEEEAISSLEMIRKEHRDARHNVFVYRIANKVERVSDDGEPSGTAGVPILDILRGEKLQNVLVVVTRYFGGILLGTGGLVKAYSTAAKNVIAQSEKIELKLCDEYELKFDYNYFNTVNYVLNEHNITVKESNFAEKVLLLIIVEKSKMDTILQILMEKTDRNLIAEKKQTYYN